MPMVPTYTFIDRATGRFNRAMGFKKDYAALISAAYEIDQCYDQFLTNPDEDSYDAMKRMGLDGSTTEESLQQRNELITSLLEGKIGGPFQDRFGCNLTP